MEQANFKLKDTLPFVCKCGNNVFTTAFFIRRISRLVTGAAQDAVVPITIFRCAKCNEVATDLLPAELQENVIEFPKPAVIENLQ